MSRCYSIARDRLRLSVWLGCAIPRVRDCRDSTPFGSKPHSQGTPRTTHVRNPGPSPSPSPSPNPNHGNSGPWELRTLEMAKSGLLYGENCMTLTSIVFDWSSRATDRRTHGRTDRRNCDSICALSYMLSRAKMLTSRARSTGILRSSRRGLLLRSQFSILLNSMKLCKVT